MNNEAQMVEAIKKGRSSGYETLVARYAQRVFGVIARIVPNREDAEELTQDTFLKAFDHINSYDAQRASLSTWLLSIAWHVAISFLRYQQPMLLPLNEEIENVLEASNEALEAELSTGKEERIRRLQSLVNDLPPEQSLLLSLYYLDGLPLMEIALIMDSEEHALANRLYRLRKKLCKQLSIS